MNHNAPADPFGWVGHTIDGKFRIDEVIGEGGFGVVYRAFHLGFSDTIALKCLKLPASLPPAERDRFYQSFLTEGRLLHKLSRATPAIVQALDVGAAVSPAGTWTPYLVLEWLQGTPVDKLLAKRRDDALGPMPLDEAIALLDSAAEALEKAHAQGVAHRDIKPANLFITTAGGQNMMKVLDFGIAKVIIETKSLTQAMEATGGQASVFTPHYGAPEQYNRRFGATGPWTDVFAFALVLVELVSGRPALEGDDMTQLYIAATDPWHRPTLKARGIDTTDAVENVLARALHVEPRGRYPSAGAFWDALKAAMEGVDPGRISVDRSAPGAASPSGPIAAADRPDDAEASVTQPSEPHLNTTSPQMARSLPEPSGTRSSKPPVRVMFAGLAAVVAMAAVGAGAAWKLAGAEGKPVALSSFQLVHRIASLPLPKEPLDMVLVPAGSFTMGHEKAGKTERPPHQVTISRPFYIDRLEVTVADYARCVEHRKCIPSRVHGGKVDEAEAAKFAPLCNASDPAKRLHPINCIDQSEAAAYCDFAGKRLPTEAEWEYAARGTDERLYPWGNDAPGCDKGLFARAPGDGCPSRPPGTMPVGSFPANASPFGALDMAGNVWEWVADGWDPAAYRKGPRKDPVAPRAGHGVLRGGSWDFSSLVAKSTYRLAFESTMGHVSTGVRCAKNAE